MRKRSEQRKQKALMKKKQREKLRKKKSKFLTFATVVGRIQQARAYPIHECLINRDWEEGGLAYIMLSRKQPDGRILFGAYLVDVRCLGLKDTFYEANLELSDYDEVRDILTARSQEEGEVFVNCPIELIHQIIYGAIDYASSLGFEPHQDFKVSKYVLEAESKYPKEAIELEFGLNGKPCYFPGTHDDADRIIKQLETKVGAGNFDFILPGEGITFSLPEYEELPEEPGRSPIRRIKGWFAEKLKRRQSLK